jgi:hypothetical protein
VNGSREREWREERKEKTRMMMTTLEKISRKGGESELSLFPPPSSLEGFQINQRSTPLGE